MRNILLVGSGGREHALAWKLLQSKNLGKLFVAPGNGGTNDHNVAIGSSDTGKLLESAKSRSCLTIVGPEAPLAAGIVDRFQSAELPIFGPTQEQAKLETSKVFAKEFMKRLEIPTANFRVFDEVNPALDYSLKSKSGIVVKIDGLAAGKGVFVCSTQLEAEDAIRLILEKKAFGKSGEKIVLEEKLEGREISVMAICDGRSAATFGTAVDHKRLFDRDRGPNTGGMGAFSPADDFGEKDLIEIVRNILNPTVKASGFRGFLYLGLMIDKHNHAKLLEYNARLGDPETQVILPRLESDLLEIIALLEEGRTARELDLSWRSESACTVVMCSEGYPGTPRLGDEIRGIDVAGSLENAIVFHSGTLARNGSFFTNGGRTLSVTGIGSSKSVAAKRAYEGVNLIRWPGEHHRTDIAQSTAAL